MIPLLEHCWSKLSVIQPAHELQSKLEKLHEAVEHVSKNEIAVEDVLESFHQSEIAEEVKNIVTNDFFEDAEYASKLRESFLQVTQSESIQILPTIIDVERYLM